MTSDTYEVVRQAITEKKQVVAEYNEHVREMCPHVIRNKERSGVGPLLPIRGYEFVWDDHPRMEIQLAMYPR